MGAFFLCDLFFGGILRELWVETHMVVWQHCWVTLPIRVRRFSYCLPASLLFCVHVLWSKLKKNDAVVRCIILCCFINIIVVILWENDKTVVLVPSNVLEEKIPSASLIWYWYDFEMATHNKIEVKIEKLCRTCLSKDIELNSLFDITVGSVSLDFVVTAITGLKVLSQS